MSHFSMLILTAGIPGSGKTTWVKEYCEHYPLTYVVSTDEIRKERNNGVYYCDANESDFIHQLAMSRVKDILEDPENYKGSRLLGPCIIVDSTNCDVEDWLKYKALGAAVILVKYFDVPPEVADKRQQGREDKIVPYQVLQEKWEKLQENKKYFKFIFNMIL